MHARIGIGQPFVISGDDVAAVGLGDQPREGIRRPRDRANCSRPGRTSRAPASSIGKFHAGSSRSHVGDASAHRPEIASTPKSHRTTASARCRGEGAAAPYPRRDPTSCCERSKRAAWNARIHAGRIGRCDSAADRETAASSGWNRRRGRREPSERGRRWGSRIARSRSCGRRRQPAGRARRDRSADRAHAGSSDSSRERTSAHVPQCCDPINRGYTRSTR